MIALLQSYKSNLLSLQNSKQNIIAGISVGIIALPLSMAFAIASGATPASGIYTAIISALIVAIFGGTQVQVSGPTGAFVVVLSMITARYGFAGLQCATLLAGILLVCMGVFKFGSIIKFIPYTVIVGFTTGIGIVIFIGQWKSFFGLTVFLDAHQHFYEKIIMLVQSLPTLHIGTTFLSCFSLATYLISRRYIKKIPASLMTILSATVVHLLLNDLSIATIGSVFGSIPQEIPHFSLPDVWHVNWLLLIQPACTIAMLGAIESLLSAVAIDAITDSKHDSNQELIGQGLANIITPFFGGFASTGAIARTVTNVRNGANCPISAIVHSVTLLLILLLFAPYAAYIPLCTLAAILFIIAYNMSDLHQFVQIVQRAPWYDVAVLFITCFLTVLVDLVVAVLVGCLIAFCFFFIRMYQTKPMCKTSYCLNKFWRKSISNVTVERPDEYTIKFVIQGPFFFGVAQKLEHVFTTVAHEKPRYIVFDYQEVPFIDITGLTVFSKVVGLYRKQGAKISITQVNNRIARKFKKMNIDQLVEYV